MALSHFPPEAIWTFMAFGLISIVSNSISLIYIRRSFSLAKAVFLLLFVDSLSSTCFGLVSFVSLFFLSKDVVSCSVYCYFSILPIFVGNFAMALVAIIRYLGIDKVSQPNEELIIMVSMGILVSTVMTWLGIQLYNVLNQSYPMITLQICLLGEASPGLATGHKLISTVPLFVAVFSSFLFDLLIIRKVKSAVAPQTAKHLDQLITVPVRATMTSMVLFIFMVIVVIIGSIMIGTFKIWIGGGIFCILAVHTLNAIRCPIVTLLTFKGHTKAMSEINREQKKEALRLKEIKYAWRTRQEGQKVNDVQNSILLKPEDLPNAVPNSMTQVDLSKLAI